MIMTAMRLRELEQGISGCEHCLLMIRRIARASSCLVLYETRGGLQCVSSHPLVLVHKVAAISADDLLQPSGSDTSCVLGTVGSVEYSDVYGQHQHD